MRAVAWTDSLQALIMLIVSSVRCFWGSTGPSGASGGSLPPWERSARSGWPSRARAILIRRPLWPLPCRGFSFPSPIPRSASGSLFPLPGRHADNGHGIYGVWFYLYICIYCMGLISPAAAAGPAQRRSGHAQPAGLEYYSNLNFLCWSWLGSPLGYFHHQLNHSDPRPPWSPRIS